MSRIYAREEQTGRRFLVRLECDHSGCDATLKPGPNIAESGWVVCGVNVERWGGKFEYDYCDRHAEDAASLCAAAEAVPRRHR